MNVLQGGLDDFTPFLSYMLLLRCLMVEKRSDSLQNIHFYTRYQESKVLQAINQIFIVSLRPNLYFYSLN